MKFTAATALIAFTFAAAPALAQHAGHGDHATHGQAAAPSASTKDFEVASTKMHEDMGITYSGDVDTDFLRGMIPHHQGAIDMAKVALKHSKNPEIRKLAQDIIDAQEKEIAWMKGWLAKNGKQ